jgi:hypothetical protein
MTNLVLWTWAVGGTPLAMALIGLVMERLRGGIVGLGSRVKDRRRLVGARWD